MKRFYIDEFGDKITEFNLSNSEEFFLSAIWDGFKIQGEKLSDKDMLGLTTKIDFNGLSQLDNILNEMAIDRVKWNDKMVEALRRYFEKEINSIEKQKEQHDRLKLEYTAPHEYWNLHIEDLISNSNFVLSGVVQNWYHKYGSTQAKQSARKTIAAGCLIPILIFIIFIALMLSFF